MPTIPISPSIIQVNPSVLAAAGAGLNLVGLVATMNTRVPIGTVQSFSTAAGVGAFFGLTSREYAFAQTYFAGFNNGTQTPAALLFAQIPVLGVAAYLNGSNVSTLTLQQLQALSGTLTIVIDGYTWSGGTINLSAATSFSSAASIIQTALTTAPPQAGVVTAAIAAASASFTASIAGNVMYVTAMTSGTIVVGGTLTGTGVTAGTQVDAQLSGTPGGVGNYAVSKTQVVASTTVTQASGLMTVSAVTSGALAVGNVLSGAGVTAGTQITALGTGTGGIGTYIVQNNAVVASTSITAVDASPTVTFDSVSGGFIITSGVRGAASTMAYATGTLAASIGLASTNGGLLSQGSAPQTPSVFMAGVIAVNQAWATFTTAFDPDGGPGTITQKLAFSLWTSQQNNRFAYVGWETDPAETTQLPFAAGFGQALITNNYSGTIPVWEPSATGFLHEAFAMGMIASINFNATGGRITLAFKSQSGLTPGVTTQNTASNLAGNPQSPNSFGNGLNFYGAFGTATQGFQFFQRGTVSGPYVWADTFVNQIWLNQQLIAALATLLNNSNSIPYNATGYTMIEQALATPITAALNNGVIVAGVTLSGSQIAAVNSAAGSNIAPTLQQRGWYLQVQNASPAVRQQRGSPPINLWYCDGGSVHAINLASIVLQ